MPSRAVPSPVATSASASASGLSRPATSVSTTTTTRSCTSSTPTAMRPYRASRSSRFSSSLMTMTVLLNMSAMPTKTASTGGRPSIQARPIPPAAVPTICTPAATNAVVPISRILSMLSSSPTKNNSKIIPNSEMSSTACVGSTHPVTGPRRSPATIYPTMLGTRTALSTQAHTVAAKIMAPRLFKSSNSAI